MPQNATVTFEGTPVENKGELVEDSKNNWYMQIIYKLFASDRKKLLSVENISPPIPCKDKKWSERYSKQK